MAETKSILERRVAELAALARTGVALTSTLDLSVILDRVVESAVELIGAQRCAVFELDPDDQRLHARVARGMRPGQPFIPLKVGQGAAGSAAHLRQPVFTPDIHREPLPGYDEELEGGMTLRDIVRQRGYRAILAVPLLSKENVLGAICVYWDEVHALDEREVRLLTALAQQAAVAIENSRLVSDLRRALDGLKTAQEQVVRGETLRAVGTLASGTSHT